MKKFVSVILVFFMLLIIFSACEKNSVDDIELNTTDETVRDMNGAVLSVCTRWANQFYAEVGFSYLGDKQLERYAEAKEKYNFDVNFYDEPNPQTHILQTIAGQQDVPDVLDTEALNAYPLYKQDILIPIDDIKTIDLSLTRWGPETFRRYGMFGGRPFGVYYYDWEDVPHYAGVIMFNYELMLKMGETVSPYEMQEQGIWLWDNFKELITKYTTTFNEVALTGLGVLNPDYYLKTAIFSNGGEIVTLRDGKYICALDSNEAMAGMEFAASLYKEKIAKNATLPDFVKGLYVFLYSESWQGTVMSETAKAENRPIYSMDNYGFMPFPNSPNVPYKNSSSFVHSNRRLLWVINGSEDEPDDVGYMMDKIFSPLPGDKAEAWKDYAEEVVFLHPEGCANYINMVENVKYDYSTELDNQRTKINETFNAIAIGTRPAATGVESIYELINTLLDQEMNS